MSGNNGAGPRESSAGSRYYAKRVQRVEEAWLDSDGQPEKAWEALYILGPNSQDSEKTRALIRDDVASNGLPSSWEEFADHYNRIIDLRVQLFQERYSVGGLLGEGSFSRVMRAKHAGSTDVALKLTPKNAKKASVLEAIESEMNIWAKLSHPGIVQLYDIFELPKVSVLSIELCRGGCLLDQLMDEGAMTEAQVLGIAKQVIAAVVHLHQVARVAHRDIKPENVLCTHRQPHLQGQVKLADFGFSVEFGPSEHAVSNRFIRLVGTPEYFAPEIVAAIEGRRSGRSEADEDGGTGLSYDERVDVWSLGCLLYELLRGTPPFLSEDDDELFEEILHAPVPYPEKPFKDISPLAIELLKGMLERDPERRLAGAALRDHPWLDSQNPENEQRYNSAWGQSARTLLLADRPAQAKMTWLIRGHRIKPACLATTAALRLSCAGRDFAARRLQEDLKRAPQLERRRGSRGSTEV